MALSRIRIEAQKARMKREKTAREEQGLTIGQASQIRQEALKEKEAKRQAGIPESLPSASELRAAARNDLRSGNLIHTPVSRNATQNTTRNAATIQQEIDELTKQRDELRRTQGSFLNSQRWSGAERETSQDIARQVTEMDNQLYNLMREKRTAEYITDALGKEYDDNFFGQFAANYRLGRINQDVGAAYNDWLNNDNESIQARAQALAMLQQQFQEQNADVLDDDGWVRKTAAGYLPQFFDQTAAQAGGGALGFMVGGVGGARVGASVATSAQSLGQMQGAAFQALLAEGFDEETAREAARDEGFLSALIEGAGTYLSFGLNGSKMALNAAANAALKNGTKNAAVQMIASKLGTAGVDKIAKEAAEWAGKSALQKAGAAIGGAALNAGGEYLEEAAQEAVSIANKRRENTGFFDLVKESGGVAWDAVTGKDTEARGQMHEAGTEGFKIGLMFGGTQTAVNAAVTQYANAKTREEQKAVVKTILEDKESLDALIQEGKETGAESAKIAGEIEGKSLRNEEITEKDVERLIAANDVYIEAEVKKAAKEAAGKKTLESTVSEATGYGKHGTNSFIGMVESMNADPGKVRMEFQRAYEAGLTELPRERAALSTPIQEEAYNAGRLDRIAEMRKPKNNVVVRKDAGFDRAHLPSDVTEAQYKAVDALAKATGVRVRIAKGLKGNAEISEDGTVLIAEDFQREVAGKKRSIMFYAAHEIGMHRLMQLAPKEGRAFIDAIIRDANAGLAYGQVTVAESKQAVYAAQDVHLTTGKAMEEVAADSIYGLYDNEEALISAIERVINGKDEQAKQGARKFRDILNDIVKKLKAAIAKLTGKERAEAQQTLTEVEQLRDLFEKGLAAATKRAKTVAESKNGTKTVAEKRDGKVFRNTEADGTDVVTTSVGNPVMMSDENGSAQLSLRTYEAFGRAELKRWLDLRVEKKQLTREDAQDIVKQLDEYYDMCQKFKDKYAPFGAWSDASVVTDNKGKPVFSVVKANGEYAMNLDFSLVCKKRRTLDAVFGEMIKRGMMDNVDLAEADIAKINDIIRESGFETACALCFVDAKRYRQAKVADTFVNQYNEMVRMLIPEGSDVKAHHFDFTESGNYKDSGRGLHTLSDAELAEGFAKLRQVMKENGSKTVPHKIAKHLLAVQRDRKLVSRSEFMNTDGFGAVKLKNPSVLKLYNSSKGSGGPKAAFSDVQYLGDILKKNNFTPARAYAVGGVRIQSFSDYIPRLVFDYLQMVGDLSAKKLPAHAYTKEAAFAKQFGMTGIKMNMSLVPAIAKDGVAPGLDKNGDYFWFDGQSFGSDVNVKGSGKTGFELAVKIQNAPGYSANCGTIAVGVSDAHIWKMLDDEDIRMIIPYHKSSLNHIVAVMNNIDQYHDYTGVQNTRFKSTGSKIDKKDFNFNEALRRTGDAKAAANEYLAWCDENGYIPKFDTFARHENYYKVLEDFSTYDNGVSAPQGAVTMTFPKEGDAFGSMAQLIQEGLEEDAILEARRDKSIPEIVDKVGAVLKEREVQHGGEVQHSLVEDEETLDFLNNQEWVKVYRAMYRDETGLYPPMGAIQGGKRVEPVEFKTWYQADENPSLIKFEVPKRFLTGEMNNKGKPRTSNRFMTAEEMEANRDVLYGSHKPNDIITLASGNTLQFKDLLPKFELKKADGGTDVPAAYNPYFHTSLSALNDQFDTAYKRPGMVVVEGYIPKSELTSGYRAMYSKDPVGETTWKSGTVAKNLKGDKARKVFLSRWFRAERVVPDAEAAKMIAGVLEGEDLKVPWNVVTPALRNALEAEGVEIDYDRVYSGTSFEDFQRESGKQHSLKEGDDKGTYEGVTFKGKEFWMAAADPNTGEIVRTWTQQEAAEADYQMAYLLHGLHGGDYVFFTTDLLTDDDRIEYDDYGDQIPKALADKINKQITVKYSKPEERRATASDGKPVRPPYEQKEADELYRRLLIGLGASEDDVRNVSFAEFVQQHEDDDLFMDPISSLFSYVDEEHDRLVKEHTDQGVDRSEADKRAADVVDPLYGIVSRLDKEFYSGDTNVRYSLRDDDGERMERELNSLRQQREDLQDEIDVAYLDDIPQSDINKLEARMAKLNADIDKLVAQERRAAVKTSMNDILANLSRYRRSDLESMAEQISDGNWDGYEDLTRDELEEALREEIDRLELSPLEMQSKRDGLYVRPVSKAQFSLKEDANLMRENAKLREVNQTLKEQFKTTKFAKVDKKALDRFTKQLLKDYSSGAEIDETRDALDGLYTYLANGEDGLTPVWNEAYKRAFEVAVSVLENATVVDDEMWVSYKDLRDRLRTVGVSISKEYSNDLYGYENLQDFRRRNAGRIKVSNDGLPVDVVYQDLANTYPELFDADEYINPADQLVHIADVLEEMRPVEINPYKHDMREAATWLANDIMERFFELPQAKPTFADKAEQKLTNQVIKDAKKLERLREQKNERIKQLIEANREKVKQTQVKERAKRDEAVQKIKERNKAKEGKTRTERNTRELRGKIVRHVEQMSKKLLRGTDKSNVPQTLQPVVAELLAAINLESNRTLDPVTGSYKKNGDGLPTKRTEEFRKLREEYEKIAANNEYGMVLDPNLLGVPSEAIPSMLDKVIAMKDIRLVDMNLDQLQTIYDVLRVVEHSILMAGKMLARSRWATIHDAAEHFMDDTESRKARKGGKVLDIETPYTFFSHFGEAGTDFYRMLRNAQDEEQRMLDQLRERLGEVVSLEDRKKAEKDIVKYKTQRGVELTLSKAHIMNIYLLNNRKQAQQHLLSGGIVQPEIGKVRKGTEAVLLTEFDVASIIGKLSDKERQMADNLQKLTLLMAEWGNKASMTVYGIKKFNDPDYWTIHSADIGINQTVEQGQNKPRSIANMGSAKALIPEARNTLTIDGVFDVFDRHASDMMCYSAWLAPMEDANRLFNYKYRDENWNPTGKTMKGILDRVAGEGSKQYWLRLMEDIQNGLSAPADTESERGVMKAIGNIKKASVSGNIRVVIQQHTAFARAAVVLGPDTMLAALGKGAAIKPMLDGWKKAVEYAPIAARKAAGGYEVAANPKQLAELLYQPKSKKGKAVQFAKDLPLAGAGKMDELTWGTIWNACEIQVGKKMKKGSAEFYQAVAELFTEVIDQTQVVDGVLQRSQAMRSGSNFMKQMTSFTGEPTQGANIIMRAYDQLRYEQDKLKRGKAIKGLGRAVSVYMFTAVLNAFAQSLVDGLRDDDDEEYWDKVWAAFSGINGKEETWKDFARNIILAGNVANNVNPMSWIPVWKDVLSVIQGYSVERMDAASLGDFFDSLSNVAKTLEGNGKYTTGYAGLKALTLGHKLLGGSSYNYLRDIEGIVRTFQVETDDYWARYETMKMMTKPQNNMTEYAALLFKAYQNDKNVYEDMYNDLLASGVEADAIKTKMESLMKKAQGVDKVSDLEQRYLAPKDQREWDSSMAAIRKSGLWGDASEKARGELEDKLYGIVTESAGSEEMREKIAQGASYGLNETEYLLYTLALDMYDTPNKSGELGGAPTNEEKAAAIAAMGNMNDGEIAFLWDTEQGYDLYDAGIDMRAYTEYIGTGGSVSADKLIDIHNKGIEEETYFDFLDMLNAVDKPTKSGTIGTFTQDEATAAVKAMKGLTRAERAALWQSVNSGWKANKNPWR